MRGRGGATAPFDRLPGAVLFDWDNTLVDTWPVIHEANNAALAAMGCRPWTLRQTRARVRRSMREAFPEMFGDRWREAREVFYARFDAIHLDRLAPCRGAEALLREFAARGVFLAVVSNKTGVNLRREAEHLKWAGYFSALVGAGDAARDKPAVDPVDMALAGGPRRGPGVWFVGDTGLDMECAANAGCTGILVGGEASSAGFPPRARIESCAALLAHIRRL